MIKDYFQGFIAVLRALGMVWKPRLRRFVLIPLFLNTVIFAVAIGGLSYLIEKLMQSYIPQGLLWLQWLLWPLLLAAFALAVFFTFSLLANFIAGPFTGLLAEQVEKQLTGKPLPSVQGISGNLRGAFVGMKTQMATLLYMLLWAIPLLLLSFIPFAALVLPFLWFLFSSWMLALGYIAIPAGNHQLTFPQIRALARKRRALVFGMGTAMSLLTLLPLFNFFALNVGTIAATLLWSEQLKNLAVKNVL